MLRPLALIVVGTAVVFGVGAGSLPAAPQQSPNAVKGELIVGFAEGVSRDEQNAILKDAGATSKKRFGQIDAVLVKVKDDEEATVTKVLSSEPRVAYVEPNHVVSVAVTPNDPSFSQLWGLHNTGQTGGTNDKDIDAPEAWDSATGDPNIVVAVTDTGVDFSHPDLSSQRWINALDPVGGGDDDGNGLVDDWSGWDFVNGDNDPFDDHRHGTHVSGTIGAAGNNGVGVVGVNWNVKIMALKFLNSAGSGTTADAIAATLYAADHGADVSSNSWGGGPYDQALLDAIEYGASQRNALRRRGRERRLQQRRHADVSGDVRLGRRPRRRRDGLTTTGWPSSRATAPSRSISELPASASSRRRPGTPTGPSTGRRWPRRTLRAPPRSSKTGSRERRCTGSRRCS